MQRRPVYSQFANKPCSKRRRGVVVILSAAAIIAVCGFTALVVDYGLLTIAQVQLQNAVDAAAHAGVADLYDEKGNYTPDVAKTTAKEFAAYNAVLGEPVVLADPDADADADAKGPVAFGRVEPDYTFDVPFTVTSVNANSVEVTASKTISLFFAPVIGHTSAEVRARAVATITPLQRADLIPLALRAPGFGVVDPKVTKKNSGKDGPSEPADGKFFKIDEEVDLLVYSKDKKENVQLTLDLGATNPSDANKVLRGDAPALPITLGEKFLVFNKGTGQNSFSVHLDTRLGKKNNPTDLADPLRTIVVPVVAIIEGSRNATDQLAGEVEVVDFVAVHLDFIDEVTTIDAETGEVFVNEVLRATVIRLNVRPDLVRTGPAGPDDPTTGEFTAYSIRLTQ